MLSQFRQQHPQYDDMSNSDLITALHRKFYSDIPLQQFAAQLTGKETIDAEERTEETGTNAKGNADEGREEGLLTEGGAIPRPTHDDLENAAVTGKDSLDLQEIAPYVKPVVKMTLAEARALKLDKQIAPSKVFWPDGKGNAYVMDKNAVQGIYGGTVAKSVFQAKKDLRKGGDAESLLLGYPKRDGMDKTIDVAVTKGGDVVHNLNAMKAHAEAGNVAWAAEGDEKEALEKAAQVSKAIKNPQIEAKANGGPIEKGNPYLVGERGPEIIVPQQNGTVIPNNETDRIRSVLEANKDKNFIQRVIEPDKWPTLDLGEGNYATHKMAYSTNSDGKEAVVYPNVVYVPTSNRLMELDPDAAYNYAMKSNEYIKMPTEQAEWFTKSYKKIWNK